MTMEEMNERIKQLTLTDPLWQKWHTVSNGRTPLEKIVATLELAITLTEVKDVYFHRLLEKSHNQPESDWGCDDIPPSLRGYHLLDDTGPEPHYGGEHRG